MKSSLAAGLAAALVCCANCAAVGSALAGDLTLAKIMADPDWIGTPVQSPFWSADGKSVYYSLKHTGNTILDQHRIALGDGRDRLLTPADAANADAQPVFDRAGKRAAFVRNGDVFVRELGSGQLRQITRSPREHADPQFSADGRLLSFRSGNDWFVHDFGSGLTSPIASVAAQADPHAAPSPDDLRDVQLRTFSTLKRLHDESETARKHADEWRLAD